MVQNDFSYNKFKVEFDKLINNESNKNKQLKMFNKLENILKGNKSDIAVSEILKLIKVN